MENKEKLISLLKEVPEIKNDLEKKDFITSITAREGNILKSRLMYHPLGECKNKEEAIGKHINIFRKEKGGLYSNIQIEVSLESEKHIEERHLRMYLNNRNDGIDWCITADGRIQGFNEEGEWNGQSFKLDNSKSFDMQSEEVYKEIYNYLIK